jgi:hypothetical protein
MEDPSTGQLTRMMLPDADDNPSAEQDATAHTSPSAQKLFGSQAWVVEALKSRRSGPKKRKRDRALDGWAAEPWAAGAADGFGATEEAGSDLKASSEFSSRNAPHLLPPSREQRRTEGEITPTDGPTLSGERFPSSSEARLMHVPEVASPSEHKPIATLAHGLDRVLFKCV